MALESVTNIADLVITNPTATDAKSEGDDHIRNIKKALKTDLPNITGPITATQAELNVLDGITASTAELNLLDGVTATTAELNHIDGVTSPIQTQLDGKQPLDADLTAIAGLSSAGMVARTGAGTASVRTLTAGAGITITNGDGVSGNPTIAVNASDLPNSAAVVSYTPAGTGAVTTTVQSKLREWVSVKDFGAVGDGVTDDTAAANLMIAEHNYLYIPPNFTLVCKNIELFDNTKVVCDGALKLPSACSDFDRLLHAANKTGIEIDIREIDGNYAGQSGGIGTHLIYMVTCDDLRIDVKYAHDHYISSGAPMTSVDGIRDVSTGAIFVQGSTRGTVKVGLLDGWGREGIQLRDVTHCVVEVGHCQGKYTFEYSGVQIRGEYCSLNRASVDFAGASGVGFDVTNGTLSNVISTNTRENHGVNFGHPGYPATGSVAENIVVDGAYVQGIQVSASSQDLTINNFSVQNTGGAGLSFSDGVLRGKATNGVVSYPGDWSVGVNAAEITLTNVRTNDRDARMVTVNTASGLFTEGETVTTAGGSAVIRKRVQNLTGAKQRLFFTSVTGAFSVAETMTGGTSGVTATVEAVSTPVEYYEIGGGQVLRDPRFFSGTQSQIRFPDGTAIFTASIACALTTGGTLQTFNTTYGSNVLWASAPTVSVTITNINSTNGYSVTILRGLSTTTTLTITLNATVAQTYSTNVIAVGRWK